jgi:hypothetical protein
MGNTNRVTLSVFKDGLESAQAQREQPAPPYTSSDVPDLVPIEEPEVVFPFKEGLNPSARARLEQKKLWNGLYPYPSLSNLSKELVDLLAKNLNEIYQQ